MALEIDYNRLTAREVRDLCEGSGVANLVQFIAAVNEMAPNAIASIVWVMKKKADPAFTFEDALDVPIDELGEMFGKNALSAAESTTTSSGRSARSTTSRRASSGKQK